MLKKSNGNRKFLNVVSGKIALQLKGPVEGSVERVKKSGVTVNELLYDSIEGEIVGLEIKDNADYGKFLQISISTDEEYVLSLPMSSRYATGFLLRSPNIDFSKPVEICTFQNDEGKGVLYLKQGGNKVYSFFTKDKPNGLPQLEQKTISGKPTWDDSLRLKWYEDKLIPRIQEKIKEANPLANSPQPSGGAHGDLNGFDQEEPQPFPDISTEQDDLPW